MFFLAMKSIPSRLNFVTFFNGIKPKVEKFYDSVLVGVVTLHCVEKTLGHIKRGVGVEPLPVRTHWRVLIGNEVLYFKYDVGQSLFHPTRTTPLHAQLLFVLFNALSRKDIVPLIEIDRSHLCFRIVPFHCPFSAPSPFSKPSLCISSRLLPRASMFFMF